MSTVFIASVVGERPRIVVIGSPLLRLVSAYYIDFKMLFRIKRIRRLKISNKNARMVRVSLISIWKMFLRIFLMREDVLFENVIRANQAVTAKAIDISITISRNSGLRRCE
jgi:hypothetical protein